MVNQAAVDMGDPLSSADLHNKLKGPIRIDNRIMISNTDKDVTPQTDNSRGLS